MIDPTFWKRVGPAVALVSVLPFYTVGGGLIGAAVDRALDSGWAVIVGALLGFTAGVWQLFRGLNKLDDHPRDPPP